MLVGVPKEIKTEEYCLEKPRGGAGILLGGVPGVEAAQVVILAGGVAGTVNGIVHYCVANMPAAVPRTSTFALNNATLPFTLALANRGYRAALSEDFHLRNGLNVHRGRITCEAVAQELQYDYQPASEAIGT